MSVRQKFLFNSVILLFPSTTGAFERSLKILLRDWRMAQSVKRFLCHHEDLSSILTANIKELVW